MTDLETVRRLSAQEQREPALQLAERAIRERDAAIIALKQADELLREGDETLAHSTIRAFLHQRDQ